MRFVLGRQTTPPPQFQFLDPGPLCDGELTLVPPDVRWVDDLLAACHDPLTLRDAPGDATPTRQSVFDFLRAAPGGLELPNKAFWSAATYHFWMRVEHADVPVRIAGGTNLRIGDTADLRLYAGHIGYHVYPPARGHRYAERSARLLLPLARRHGMSELWITCNPENTASRRTCERLGAELIETVPIPPEHLFYARGERAKCRYLIRL
jgi:tagatose 1,6-diphosphate aldolase